MKIETGTIARTIVLLLALLNQICAIMGWTPLDISEGTVYQFSSLAVTVVASVWAWWKNNSLTKEAILADQKFKELKKGTLE